MCGDGEGLPVCCLPASGMVKLCSVVSSTEIELADVFDCCVCLYGVVMLWNEIRAERMAFEGSVVFYCLTIVMVNVRPTLLVVVVMLSGLPEPVNQSSVILILFLPRSHWLRTFFESICFLWQAET